MLSFFLSATGLHYLHAFIYQTCNGVVREHNWMIAILLISIAAGNKKIVISLEFSHSRFYIILGI